MKNIKYLELFIEMKKHNETQKMVAEVLGITQQSISRKLYGTTDWTISEVDKLCEHYNKDYYELFKRID